jgi:head-tail adaptor
MSIRANVDARRLDERIRFERNTPTQADSGDLVDHWGGLIECAAAVDGAKAFGPEPAVGGSTLSKSDYTIWVRADIITRFGITQADRVVWKCKVFNIKDIPDQGLRGRMMAVICNAGMNAG